MFITFLQDITSNLPTVLMSPREKLSILISITWSLVCPDNYMMVCLITPMVLLLLLLKWLMMFLTSLLSFKEEMVERSPISLSEPTWSWPVSLYYSPSNTLKLKLIIEIYWVLDGKCIALEMDYTINISKQDNLMEELINSDNPCGHEKI